MKAGLVHVLHVLCPYYMLEHDFRLVFRSAPIRRDVSLEGVYEASSMDLKGDLSTDVLHVHDRCATTETLNVAVLSVTLFLPISLIHQVVADNKEVGSFVPRQSHRTIFFEKQCFIQESGNSFRLQVQLI